MKAFCILEPIVLDPLTATAPIVDSIDRDNFEYVKKGRTRGVFDWEFNYKWLGGRNFLPEDQNDELPMMLGCAFAIHRKLWHDLGAYDEELMIWNGENYELSLKLWLCGGRLLEVPCSRVAHMFRSHNIFRKKEGVDFVGRNFKRIAEVWLDEHKELLYNTNPERYSKIDAGDLTRPKMIREQLKCKHIDYYLQYVAPEMEERYPSHPKPDFAYGTIASIADPALCIDTLQRPDDEPVGLYYCHENKTHPGPTQLFKLSWSRNIKSFSYESCLDAHNLGIFACHHEGGNQFFKYIPVSFALFQFKQNFNKLFRSRTLIESFLVTAIATTVSQLIYLIEPCPSRLAKKIMHSKSGLGVSLTLLW